MCLCFYIILSSSPAVTWCFIFSFLARLITTMNTTTARRRAGERKVCQHHLSTSACVHVSVFIWLTAEPQHYRQETDSGSNPQPLTSFRFYEAAAQVCAVTHFH